MRKIVAVLMLVLLLCGCSKQPEVTAEEVANAFAGDFSAEAKAVFGDSEAEMSIVKNGMSISIIVSSPDEISGMGIELCDEHVKVTYQGMEQEINADSLPEGTPFLLLRELFEELSEEGEFNIGMKNDKIAAENEDFSAVISPEDFSLIRAEFPLYETEFIFSGWEFSDAE